MLNLAASFERRMGMTVELLHRLAAETLPLTLCDAEDIEGAQVLVMAGHLSATFSPAMRGRYGACPHGAATVHSVTPLGRHFLRAFPGPRLPMVSEQDEAGSAAPAPERLAGLRARLRSARGRAKESPARSAPAARGRCD